MKKNAQKKTDEYNEATYYLLKVMKGKEKRVTEFLKNVYNIDARRSPIGEYLICDNSLKAIKDMPEYVKAIDEIPAATAGAILKELVLTKKPEQEKLEINGMVRIVKGQYKGYVGILKKIKKDETVTVHVGLLGRMAHINLPVEDVVPNHLDGPWGD